MSVPTSQSSYLRGFDGLRAIAILLVIAWHTEATTRFPPAALSALRPVVMTGWAGVDLFFGLSGFLITTLILREERAHAGRFRLRDFYVRRALRILPVFYVVFLINTFVLARFDIFSSVEATRVANEDSPLGLFPYATFWGNYFWGTLRESFARAPTNPGLAYLSYWSLCVEEHFYLLWPAFIALVKQARLRLMVATSLCLALPVLRWYCDEVLHVPPEVLHSTSHFRMDSILWGAIGALVIDGRLIGTTARRVALIASAGAIALLVIRGMLSVDPPGTPWGDAVGLSLLAVATTLTVMHLAENPTGRVAAGLEWAPLRVVGRLSYAMYLVHFQCIDIGRVLYFGVKRRPTLVNFVLPYLLYVALAVIAAAVLHFIVERPFLRLKRRFASTPL